MSSDYEKALSSFRYDPGSGQLFWRDDYKKIRWAGQEAGTLNSSGYRIVTFLLKKTLTHRIIWLMHYGIWPEFDLDHKDRNKTNNNINNLRLSGKSNNMANRVFIPGATGLVGVTLSRGRFRAGIKHKGKRICLGRYDTPEEARSVYVKKAAELFGEFHSEAASVCKK